MQQKSSRVFTQPDGTIINIADDGIWFEGRTRLTFDEFEALKEAVWKIEDSTKPIDAWFLVNITQELANRFSTHVQIVKVMGLVSTAHPSAEYTITILDSRDGLLYDCSTRGTYREVLQQIPPWIR